MPELAEIKLMSDFINNFKGPFVKTFKSKITKIDTPDLKVQGILDETKTRGKELMLNFKVKNKLFHTYLQWV